MLKYSFYLIAAILFAVTISACKEDTVQPVLYGTINGTVMDADDNSLVGTASVTTNPPTGAIITDSKGAFSIKNAPTGNYSVSASKPGYNKGTVSISVNENSTTEAIIFLTKKTSDNTAPALPSNPAPSNGSVNDSVSLTLKWYVPKTGGNDSLLYDVYLYESSSADDSPYLTDYNDTALVVENLKFNTTYYWQVAAKDTAGKVTFGNIWSFKTQPFPDNRVVFASNRDGNYEIYSSNEAGSDIIRLTNNANKDLWPVINTKLKQIAFSSDASISTEIYSMNIDGSGVQKLTDIPLAGYHNNGTGFSWSADGGSLLYANYDKMYSVNANGTNPKLIAQAPAGRNFRECGYSPDGSKIVALTIGTNFYDSEIYIMNSDGGNMTALIDNLPGAVESPSFSVDGKSVIFTHDVAGYEGSNNRQLDSHIFIVKTGLTDTVDVSYSKPDGTNDLYPRFSPNGSKIIFTNQQNDGSGKPAIWVMDIDGTNRVKIIDDGTMPDWK